MLIQLALLSLALSISARPLITDTPQLVLTKSAPRPLVIWHGLGDTALSEGITSFIEDIKTAHPGIFVYSVQIPLNGTLEEERKAGFYGKAEEQAKDGCEQINSAKELAGGFDGMGFSQGGLFLRSYAQYCDGPPMRNLITFGTPHYGISSLIPCPTPPSLTCLLAARAARAGIYTSWAQSHLVQAQYYRDPARLEEFLDTNTYLRDLNAEGYRLASEGEPGGAEDGGKGLRGIEKLVAVLFDADRTVSPAQSAHFATYSPENKTLIIPLEQQRLYTEDWIGLRALDERGGFVREHCPGEHMDLGAGDCGMRMVEKYVGG